MKSKSLILNFIICLCLFCNITETALLVAELETCQHEFNPAFIQNLTYELTMVDSRRVLNGSMIMAIDVTNFKLQAIVQTVQKNRRTITWANTTIDGCEYLQQMSGMRFGSMDFIFKEIRQFFKNFPDKCPLKKNSDLELSNLYIEVGKFPVYVPQTPFEFQLFGRTDNVVTFRLFLTGKVMQKTKKRGNNKHG